MGIAVTVILAILSFVAAKAAVNLKPEISQWSVNKKQALTLVWFSFSVAVFLLVKMIIQPESDTIQQFWGSFGISIIMGIIFYNGLSPKKQTV